MLNCEYSFMKSFPLTRMLKRFPLLDLLSYLYSLFESAEPNTLSSGVTAEFIFVKTGFFFFAKSAPRVDADWSYYG